MHDNSCTYIVVLPTFTAISSVSRNVIFCIVWRWLFFRIVWRQFKVRVSFILLFVFWHLNLKYIYIYCSSCTSYRYVCLLNPSLVWLVDSFQPMSWFGNILRSSPVFICVIRQWFAYVRPYRSALSTCSQSTAFTQLKFV